MPADQPLQTILAFDIGIRNLAWCLMRGPQGQLDASGAPAPASRQILGWQNYDLLTGTTAGASPAAGKPVCSSCGAGASFQSPKGLTCLRHCPASHPPLRGPLDASGAAAPTPLKKIPPLAALRLIASSSAAAAGLPPPKKSASRADLVAALASRHSLPLERVKLKKAVEHELTTLHDGIRAFVTANAENFRQATHILLENQPVLKNPTMKTVQILLFATLRDVLQPGPPPLKLVHAGKKVKGQAAGDAGYKSRKDASEAVVLQRLGGVGAPAGGAVASAPRWLETFRAAGKKSDLADAFNMCWDRLSTPSS